MQRALQFLLDMLQSAELSMNYTAQYSKDQFVGNVQLQDSVIRRLLVIAEAARRVSKNNSPDLAKYFVARDQWNAKSVSA